MRFNCALRLPAPRGSVPCRFFVDGTELDVQPTDFAFGSGVLEVFHKGLEHLQREQTSVFLSPWTALRGGSFCLVFTHDAQRYWLYLRERQPHTNECRLERAPDPQCAVDIFFEKPWSNHPCLN